MTIAPNFRDVIEMCGTCIHCRVEQSSEWVDLICIKHDSVLDSGYTICDDYFKREVYKKMICNVCGKKIEPNTFYYYNDAGDKMNTCHKDCKKDRKEGTWFYAQAREE